MQLLDALNNLDLFPLRNLDTFIERCIEKGIHEINVTGSNTDPLLYRHTHELKAYLQRFIPNLVLGIRTNGVLSKAREDVLRLYDKGSVTICSFDKAIYAKMMGRGEPPDLDAILPLYSHFSALKLNVVLGDENVQSKDFLNTIEIAESYGFNKVNLREPYGQAHIGNPLEKLGFEPDEIRYGMPCYRFGKTVVTYWDVHYVEVESVNLYANGVVSLTYPVTKGHDPAHGKVVEQSKWGKGRHFSQWNKGQQPTQY